MDEDIIEEELGSSQLNLTRTVTEEVEDMALDTVELSAARAPAVRTQSVEEVSQSREGLVGGVLSNRRSRAAKKSKAMAPVAEAIPAAVEETPVPSGVEPLPNSLSASEQSTLSTSDIESILRMGDDLSPTKSLEVLWFASFNRDPDDAIVLLLRSADYAHGDRRYLKRNWMRLSQLYAGQGNVQRAQYYQEMADALP